MHMRWVCVLKETSNCYRAASSVLKSLKPRAHEWNHGSPTTNLRHGIDNWRRTKELGVAAGTRTLALHLNVKCKNIRAHCKRPQKLADHGTRTVVHHPGQHLVVST